MRQHMWQIQTAQETDAEKAKDTGKVADAGGATAADWEQKGKIYT